MYIYILYICTYIIDLYIHIYICMYVIENIKHILFMLRPSFGVVLFSPFFSLA